MGECGEKGGTVCRMWLQLQSRTIGNSLPQSSQQRNTRINVRGWPEKSWYPLLFYVYLLSLLSAWRVCVDASVFYLQVWDKKHGRFFSTLSPSPPPPALSLSLPPFPLFSHIETPQGRFCLTIITSLVYTSACKTCLWMYNLLMVLCIHDRVFIRNCKH